MEVVTSSTRMPAIGANGMRASSRLCDDGPMFETVVDAVSGSAWSYVIVFAIAAIDAFFPAVPSEATAIAAGVVAGAGGLHVELVIVAAAVGAFVGDNFTFVCGHFLGERLSQRFFQGEKAKKRVDWAKR